MKHLFVPYELALKLKDKGFDEPCFSEWQDKTFLNTDWDDEYQNSFIATTVGCAAPLYQQVTDWFREKHKIYVSADQYGRPIIAADIANHPLCKKGKIGYKGELLAEAFRYKTNTIKVSSNYGKKEKYYAGFAPYEALNIAIEEALKLI